MYMYVKWARARFILITGNKVENITWDTCVISEREARILWDCTRACGLHCTYGPGGYIRDAFLVSIAMPDVRAIIIACKNRQRRSTQSRCLKSDPFCGSHRTVCSLRCVLSGLACKLLRIVCCVQSATLTACGARVEPAHSALSRTNAPQRMCYIPMHVYAHTLTSTLAYMNT